MTMSGYERENIQTFTHNRWIKMPLGVGRTPPRPCARWGPSSPDPQKGHSPPIFGPYLLWPKGWMDQDATWYGGRPRPIDEDFAPPPIGSGAGAQYWGQRKLFIYCAALSIAGEHHILTVSRGSIWSIKDQCRRMCLSAVNTHRRYSSLTRQVAAQSQYTSQTPRRKFLLYKKPLRYYLISMALKYCIYTCFTVNFSYDLIQLSTANLYLVESIKERRCSV